MFETTSLYDDKDAKRYNNAPKGSKPELARLTDGPGDYLLRVDSVRYGQASKSGKTYYAMDLEVLKAAPNKGEQTHQVGDMVTHVVIIDNKYAAKEALEMGAAVMGLPPVVKIPDGELDPYGGRVLVIAEMSDLATMAEDQGAAVQDQELWAECYNFTKTKGKYAGKTFTNTTFAPAQDGAKGRWKQYADFDEATLRGIAEKRWG